MEENLKRNRYICVCACVCVCVCVCVWKEGGRWKWRMIEGWGVGWKYLLSDFLHLLHFLQFGGIVLDLLQPHVCAQPHQETKTWTHTRAHTRAHTHISSYTMTEILFGSQHHSRDREGWRRAYIQHCLGTSDVCLCMSPELCDSFLERQRGVVQHWYAKLMLWYTVCIWWWGETWRLTTPPVTASHHQLPLHLGGSGSAHKPGVLQKLGQVYWFYFIMRY